MQHKQQGISDVQRENTVTAVLLCPPHVPAGNILVRNAGVRGKRPALNRPSNGLVFGAEIETNFI